MNSTLKVFLSSMVYISIPSALIGGIFALFGYSFWIGFLASAAIQFIIGGMYNAFLQHKDEVHLAEINAMIELAQAEKHIDINCSFCNVTNTVPFFFKQSNAFTCKACNNKNELYVEFTTARKTIPIVSKGDISTAETSTPTPKILPPTTKTPVKSE